MIELREVILDQFMANANDPSWYISFIEATDGINEKEAFWKPDTNSHSVAEIVQHLIYWNRTWQIRYKQSDFNSVQTVKENAETFSLPDKISFNELRNELLGILLHWQKLIKDNPNLSSSVVNFPVEAKWGELLGNAITHNAYHIGQIVYIRKMNKS